MSIARSTARPVARSVAYGPASNKWGGGGLSIFVTDGRGEITVPAGAFTLTVNGQDYALNTADIIGQPPVFLEDAEIANDDADTSSSITEGDTLTATAGVFVYDPDGGEPVVTYAWVRNSTDVSTGAGRTVVADDVAIGLQVREEATNAYGTGSKNTDVIVVVPYVEAPLVFTSAQSLYKSSTHSADADNLMIALSFKYKGSGSIPSGGNMCANRTSAGSYAIYHGIYADGSGNLKAYMKNISNQNIINFYTLLALSSLSVNDRATFLMYGGKTGTIRVSSIVNGVVVSHYEGSASPDGTKLPLLNRPFAIGASARVAPPSTAEDKVTADIYDCRWWADLASVPDFTDVAVRRLFINDDGTTVSPIIAELEFGEPIIQMPTNATDANNLVNEGSNGAFTSKYGTFS